MGFDSSRVEIENISTDDSFANIFIQKEINNDGGYARLSGGLPNPGFFSDRGIFGTVYFRGKVPGIVKIEFLPSSMVLANDGHGTNVLKDLASASYLILPERISEEEEVAQKEASFVSNTLGESTSNTQMRFYEDTPVLGAKIGQDIKRKERPSLPKQLLGFLEKVDRLILTMWGRALGLNK